MRLVRNTLALLLLVSATLSAQRPQEPVRPYPYHDETVHFDNPRADSVRLAGTLTIPEGQGPFPAVVLVSGSGPQDRDESVEGHKPFLVLADDLTRRGISVLRYDDRGQYGSTGDFAAATTEDLAGDALAAVEYLTTRPEVDADQIGVVGHSEGGYIAPMVAVRSSDVAFIVLLAGPGISGEQINYAQLRYRLESAGATEPQILFNLHRNAQFNEAVKQEPDDVQATEDLLQIWTDWLDGKILPEEISDEDLEPILAELESLTQEIRDELTRVFLETGIPQLLRPWFRFFVSYDPYPTLARVQIPVLAVNGTKDVQVEVDNLPVIGAALSEGGNEDFLLVELPGLNHLFQTANTGASSEYAQIEETFAPAALDVIGEWIVAHTTRPTAVVETFDKTTPDDFSLAQNHPNPFNGQTLIPFSLDESGAVTLSLYNALGQRVSVLVKGWRDAGNYTVHWDGRDDLGQALGSGMYFYSLETSAKIRTRQLIMLR